MRKFVLFVITFLLLGSISELRAQLTPCPTIASITGQDTICAGAEIQLTDSTSGGTWTSSDVTKATIEPSTGVVAGVSGGTAVITYALSPSCFVTRLLVINALLPITGDTAVCVGSTVILSDGTAGGTWSSSNTTVATISSGNAFGVASGNTIITYMLANGCSRKINLVVNPLPPNYYVFGGGIYCAGTAGATIGLNGSDVGINYKLYRDDTAFVDSLHGTGSALFYGPYATPGVYTIIAVNITTGCTRQMSGIASIGITPLNIPSVSIYSPTQDTICILASATFTAITINGGATPEYQWYVNGTAMGGATLSDTFSYVPITGDVVSVTLYSDAVCAIPSTADASSTVVTIPKQTPSVSLSVAPGDSVCEFIPVTLIPAPIYGGPSPTYRWIKNGITATISPSYSYLPANGDNILCVLYSDYQCLVTDSAYSTNNINLTVLPLLVPTVTVTAHPGTTIGVGESDTLAAVVVNGGTLLDYQWEINGVPVPGATSDTFVSSTFANHDTVTCVVTSVNFCGGLPASAHVVITDTLHTTGMQNLSRGYADVKLIPNPTNATFTIDGLFATGTGEARIEITDMLGKTVYSNVAELQNGSLRYHICLDDQLSGGVYLVRVAAGGATVLKRLVISK